MTFKITILLNLQFSIKNLIKPEVSDLANINSQYRDLNKEILKLCMVRNYNFGR